MIQALPITMADNKKMEKSKTYFKYDITIWNSYIHIHVHIQTHKRISIHMYIKCIKHSL